jgi:hypothetical protein
LVLVSGRLILWDKQVNRWYKEHSNKQDASDRIWYDVSDVGSKEGTAIIDFGGILQIKDYTWTTGKEASQSRSIEEDEEDEENLVPCAGIPNSDFMLNITSFYPDPISSESERKLGFNTNNDVLQKEFDLINNPLECRAEEMFPYVYRPYGATTVRLC